MMMRAQTNIKTAVNRPLRERLGSLIPGQSLAGGVRDGSTAYTRATSLFIRCAPPVSAADKTSAILLRVAKSRRRVPTRRPLCRYCPFRSPGGPQLPLAQRAIDSANFSSPVKPATSCARNVSGYPRSSNNLYHAANAERTDTIACSRGAAERAPRSEVSKARGRSGP
jgi:hypothetical protein